MIVSLKKLFLSPLIFKSCGYIHREILSRNVTLGKLFLQTGIALMMSMPSSIKERTCPRCLFLRHSGWAIKLWCISWYAEATTVLFYFIILLHACFFSLNWYLASLGNNYCNYTVGYRGTPPYRYPIYWQPLCEYSRTLVTRTLKGNEKQFELAGNSRSG